ncbi:MAG TPA: hypothetical protein VJ327_11130 [Patescibacteria group bacterium]|nr:hypothetical protein [Patescibacteria group bacterium]
MASKIDYAGIAHEIWAASQLAQDEGIEDSVGRIEEILRREFDNEAKGTVRKT